MNLRFLIVVCAVVLGFCAEMMGVEILRADPIRNEVLITHDSERRWEMRDQICILRNEVHIACGEVSVVTLDDAVVKLKRVHPFIENRTDQDNSKATFVELVFTAAELRKTDKVLYIEPETMAPDETTVQSLLDGLINLRRSPASLENRYIGKDDLLGEIKPRPETTDEGFHHGLISNLSIGLNYIFPMVHYQQAISDSFAPGIMPTIFNLPLGNGSLDGFGTFFTLNRYGVEPFHGDWLQVAVGFYSLNAKSGGVTENFLTPAVLVNAGWRWFWEGGVNFGFVLGVQYVVQAKPANSNLDFGGILPNLGMDLGFAF